MDLTEPSSDHCGAVFREAFAKAAAGSRADSDKTGKNNSNFLSLTELSSGQRGAAFRTSSAERASNNGGGAEDHVRSGGPSTATNVAAPKNKQCKRLQQL